MSYLGAATQAVGGELQGWASVMAKRNMANAFKDEQARQEGYRREGTGTFEKALPTMGREQADVDMAAGREQRMRDYARNTAVPLGFTVPNAATSGQDRAYGAITGERRAALGAYSDWGLQQMIRNIRTQQALDKITNFAGGTASVYPYRMYEAQHSMDKLAMIGAAISALGGGAQSFQQYTQPPQGGGGNFNNALASMDWSQVGQLANGIGGAGGPYLGSGLGFY